MKSRNQYIIARVDLLTDPVTIITEGLLIGRLQQCELLLNHPSVSRVQAGIKQVDDEYFLFALRPSNPVLLNGKPVTENEVLVGGDVLGVGPFRIDIDETNEALILGVTLVIGAEPASIDVSSPGMSTEKLVAPGEKRQKRPRPSPLASSKALDIFWDKRIREAGKMVRPSPLFPRGQRRSGKTQFNWVPTTDLRSRWPTSLFLWGAIFIALVSLVAAFRYANAYAPAPLSSPHTRAKLSVVPPIAARPNAGSCTSCHSLKGHMESRCAECHRAEAFVATVIKPHESAGIGCIDCHIEHKGANFDPTATAFKSCTECHNDANSRSYAGRKVGTAHGGSFGYPVVNGVWSFKTINDDDWSTRNIPIVRLESDTDDKWRSKQFHALHSERIKLIGGLTGNAAGQVSCSTCHKSFTPIDRETPRTTCGVCHSGSQADDSSKGVIAAGAPNCTSCHVQHVQDKRRWGQAMLVK